MQKISIQISTLHPLLEVYCNNGLLYETAALLAELEHIRNERAEEKKRMEHKKQKEDLKLKEVELIHGYPLLNPT